MQASKRRGERKEGRKMIQASERISRGEYGDGAATILLASGVQRLGARARLLLERGAK